MKKLIFISLLTIVSLAQSPNLSNLNYFGGWTQGVRATLAQPVQSTDLSIYVQNGTCYSYNINIPCNIAFYSNQIITIDGENIMICSVNLGTGNTTVLNVGLISCPSISGRGLQPTVAAQHFTSIVSNFTSYSYNQLLSYLQNGVLQHVPGNNIISECALASNNSQFLLVYTKDVPSNSTQVCNAPIIFYGKGSILPSSGTTFTMSVQSAPLSDICDISLNGNCIINSPNIGVYPEWWGAIAGAGDSTASWNAMFSSVANYGNCINTTCPIKINVPFNNGRCYIISSTLSFIQTIGNSAGVSIEGTLQANGVSGSCITWAGASTAGVMMLLRNSPYSYIKNLDFNGGGLAWIGLVEDTDNLSSGHSSTYAIINENLSIGGMNGLPVSSVPSADIYISQPTNCGQVSEFNFRHLNLTGNINHPVKGIYVSCGGNTKDWSIEDSTFTELDIPIDIISGGFNWCHIAKNEFLQSQTTDISITTGNCTIEDNGSEGSASFLTGGGSNEQTAFTLQGNYWSGVTNSSLNVIALSNVSLILKNNLFNNGFGTNQIPRISLTNVIKSSNKISLLDSSGNTFANVTDTTGFAFDDSNAGINVALESVSCQCLVNVKSFGDFGSNGSGTSVTTLSSFNGDEGTKVQTVYVPDTLAVNNAPGGTTAIGNPPNLRLGDVIRVGLNSTLGTGLGNTFQYAGIIGSGAANTAYGIVSCYNTANGLTTAYTGGSGAGSIINLQVTQHSAVIKLCDLKQ
jgi:hypothetical protein